MGWRHHIGRDASRSLEPNSGSCSGCSSSGAVRRAECTSGPNNSPAEQPCATPGTLEGHPHGISSEGAVQQQLASACRPFIGASVGAGGALAAFNKQLVTNLGGYLPIGSSPSSPAVPGSPICGSQGGGPSGSGEQRGPTDPAGFAGARCFSSERPRAASAAAAESGFALPQGADGAATATRDGDADEASDGGSFHSRTPSLGGAPAAEAIAETGATAVVTLAPGGRRVHWRQQRRRRNCSSITPGPAGLTDGVWRACR
jgi:hypothetical protein